MRGKIAAAVLSLGLATAALGSGVAQAAPQGPPSGSFQLKSNLHGMCLTTDGTKNVAMHPCDPGGFDARQVWKMEGEKFRSRLNGYCLDVRHGEVNGAVQTVGDCHNHANQRWHWDGDDHNGYQLRTLSTLQVMGIQNNGETRPGAGINMRGEHNPRVAWQLWKAVPV